MKKLITPNEKVNELLKWSVEVEPFKDEEDVENYLILLQIDPEEYGFSSYTDMAKYIWETGKEEK